MYTPVPVPLLFRATGEREIARPASARVKIKAAARNALRGFLNKPIINRGVLIMNEVPGRRRVITKTRVVSCVASNATAVR